MITFLVTNVNYYYLCKQKSMIERIKKLMEKKGFSPSQFADEIGLKRSSLSHILSGRNNPSLDVVVKIKTRFNDINTDWLLFGVGSETGEVKANNFREDIPKKAANETGQQLLAFGTKPDRQQEQKEEKERPFKESHQSVGKASHKTADLERIIIMYTNKTFEFYESR
jgi:transcriptional regulator with XRE-family HTH domain